MSAFEELELETNEAEEEEAIVTYDIATYPSDFTLGGIHEMWRNGDIAVPDFQRGFVWNIRQSSLLIESFLSGLPVPSVFFYIDEENKNLVIDGQQRILSVVFFFEGFFGQENYQARRQIFRLTGLNEKSPYNGKKFDELSQSDQRKLRNTVLRAINIRQLSPVDDDNTSMYHIFERLNTGGTALKPQEIRNSVFHGSFVNILRTLNEDPSWRAILGRKVFDKQQRDVEIILRIFALTGAHLSYEKPMKEFLNKAMKRNRKGNSKKVVEFVRLFPAIASMIILNLGEKPFHPRGRLNVSILDAVFCTLLNNHENIPSDLPKRYNALVNNARFIELTSGAAGSSDVSILRERFALAQSTLIDN